MQKLAECILEACSALPDSELTAPVEADARSNAKILFRQSVDAYHKVGRQLQHIKCSMHHLTADIKPPSRLLTCSHCAGNDSHASMQIQQTPLHKDIETLAAWERLGSNSIAELQL